MTSISPSKIIGIDPGKNGGLVVLSDGEIKALKCPDTPEGMATLFGVALNGDAPIDTYFVCTPTEMDGSLRVSKRDASNTEEELVEG